jgi:hypothetical protein
MPRRRLNRSEQTTLVTASGVPRIQWIPLKPRIRPIRVVCTMRQSPLPGAGILTQISERSVSTSVKSSEGFLYAQYS